MCMGGGGGGGFGGGGMGGGGSFVGSDFSAGNMGTGLSFGGEGSSLPVGEQIVKPVNPNVKEGEKGFLGSKPGFDEKKLTALANRSGKQSLYVS